MSFFIIAGNRNFYFEKMPTDRWDIKAIVIL
jgi:hypothetical protein